MMGVRDEKNKARATWKLARVPKVRAGEGKALVHLPRDYLVLTSLRLGPRQPNTPYHTLTPH